MLERVGKGGGYSDLEYAIGRELGFVDDATRVATTVHPSQLVDAALPVTEHDFRVDLVVTPVEVISVRSARRQPRGILEDHLTDAIRAEVPILNALRRARTSPRS